MHTTSCSADCCFRLVPYATVASTPQRHRPPWSHLDGRVHLEERRLDGLLIPNVERGEADHGKLVQQVHDDIVQGREPGPSALAQCMPQLQRIWEEVGLQ